GKERPCRRCWAGVSPGAEEPARPDRLGPLDEARPCHGFAGNQWPARRGGVSTGRGIGGGGGRLDRAADGRTRIAPPRGPNMATRSGPPRRARFGKTERAGTADREPDSGWPKQPRERAPAG